MYRIEQLNISTLDPLRKRGIQEGRFVLHADFAEHLSTGGKMANHGMLRNYRFSDTAEDIRGSKVYGLNDEKLGKIDDVIFDYATGEINYVVVDTGGWLTSAKFVVPVERLRESIEHEDDFSVNLNKQQIEGFPSYDEGDLESYLKWADY